MLSAAKHLSRSIERPFATLRVTWCRDGMVKKIGFPKKPRTGLKPLLRTVKREGFVAALPFQPTQSILLRST